MNWDNLKKGYCPECEGMLIEFNQLLNCECCSFTIRKVKYFDLIKGKQSKAYQAKLKKWQRIADYHKNKKEKINKAKELQDKERQFNLTKMQRCVQ